MAKENSDFTDSQLQNLRLIHIVNLTAMVINLILAAYILLRLIIPLKIKGVFIIQFYVVSMIMTALRFIESIGLIINPGAQRWEYKQNTSNNMFSYFSIAAAISFYALGCLVTSTMFQIAVSIRVMLQTITPQTAKRFKCIFNTFLFLTIAAMLFFVIYGEIAEGLLDFRTGIFMIYVIVYAI